MSYYPYVESQRVWGKSFKLNINSRRTEDWYGLVGFYQRAGGDLQKALRDMSSWNPYTRDMINEGDTVIDVGANEGLTTLLFALKVGPRGRVLAIEPDPVNVELIRKNLELNDIKNVEIFQRACGEKSNEVRRFCDERVQLDEVGYLVDTICLDDLSHYEPNFIKVDVEAYEVPVLRGAKKILATKPKWEIEMHLSEIPGGVNMTTFFGYDPSEIIDTLQQEHGYELRQDGRLLEQGEIPRSGSIWCTRGERVIHALPK